MRGYQNKNTSTCFNVFNDWRHARGEERVLEDIPVEELDAVLCKFYAEVRRKAGEEYEPDSLAVMQALLDGRPYRILRSDSSDYQIGLGRPRNFSHPILSKLAGCSPITYTNILIYKKNERSLIIVLCVCCYSVADSTNILTKCQIHKQEPLFFNSLGLIGSCVAMFVLAVLYEGLKQWRARLLQQHARSRPLHQETATTNPEDPGTIEPHTNNVEPRTS